MDRNSKEYSVLKLGEFMKVEDRNLSYIMFSEVQLTAIGDDIASQHSRVGPAN